MIIRSIFYVVKQAFINLWRNRTMSFASIISVSATLMILGVVFLLVINVSNLTDYISDQFNSVVVHLEKDLSNAQMRELGEKIQGIDGVSKITFRTKEQALEKMKSDWKEQSTILAGLEERNPLPNSYVVEMSNLVYADSIVNQVSTFEGVEFVKYYQDIIVTITSVTDFIRSLGTLIIAILLSVSTFVISNTIKLAVTARKSEIQIMKYVGATHWFIRWPFIIEGMLLGFIGSVVAIGAIYLGYSYTYEILTSNFYVLIAAYIVPVKGIMSDLFQVFLPVGMGIGALGGLWGVKKYLNV